MALHKKVLSYLNKNIWLISHSVFIICFILLHSTYLYLMLYYILMCLLSMYSSNISSIRKGALSFIHCYAVCSREQVLTDRERQIKNRWAITSHLSEWLSLNQPTSFGEDVEKKGILVHYWWDCIFLQPPWKNIMHLSQKNKNRTII